MPDANVSHVPVIRKEAAPRRAIGAAVSLFLVAALAACSGNGPPPPAAVNVIAAKPLKRKIVDWDDFVGHFEAVNSVDIRPRVTGYLQSIDFRDGQMVRKGDLLFVIDPRPYQATLDQAKGQEAHALSAQSDANIELARAKKLLADGAISQQEYQTRLATAQQATGDVLAAKAAVESAALNLAFTRVTSPINGRASDRRVAPGNLVTQDQTILTNITDLDPIRFIFDGAESLYLKYQSLGQMGSRPESRYHPNPVEIRLQNQSGYDIKGQMDFVDNTLDTNSGTIRGRAVISNPRLLLTPGMFGHLRLLGSGTYDALLIPDDAITTQQSDQIVYVVGHNNRVEQRKIVTGPLVDGLRVVRNGLQSSDNIVIEGAEHLKAGIEVSPKPGRIVPPHPGLSPTPADLAPPPGAATFARPH
ncbi:MAG TPA: efflux RND transporter periplasmic adaptor subunit [Rhizomicrobium sp.]|jgi:RND family efflux transporter MFP subunit|nr:efflux RND transporter periplasmic adaptor subunit [Rhizomicrobium sp.]